MIKANSVDLLRVMEQYMCNCVPEEEAGEEEQAPVNSETETAARRRRALAAAARTAAYLRERRIPELLRFLLARLLAHVPDRPLPYLTQLLDECMLYRAGLGLAPLLYEDRHVKELVRSFDPGERGWMSAAQLRRARTTLGLEAGPPDSLIEDRLATEEVLDTFIAEQRGQLLALVSAGTNPADMKDFDDNENVNF